MSEEQINSRTRASGTLATRVDPDELAGLWTKTLEVPSDRRGVAVWDDEADVLEPRTHRFAGFGNRPRPNDITLIQDGPITLHPTIGGLLSGDDDLLEAECLIKVRISEPVRFYTALARDHEVLTSGELAAMVAGEAQSMLQGIARRYSAEALCRDDSVAEAAAGELRGFVAAYLEPMGIEVEALRYLHFRRAEDAVTRAEAFRRLRSKLRDTEVRERLDAIQTRADFVDTVKQIAYEQGLRDRFRRDEVEMLADEIWDEEVPGSPSSPAAPASDGRRPAESLDTKLETLEDQLVARFEALLRKVGYEGAEDARVQAIEETIERLRRWITILRALGMIVIFGTTLATVFVPDFFVDDNLPRIITSVAGLIVAILMFASAMWLHGRVKAHRRAIREAKTKREITPAERKAAERLVRARVNGALQQTESNLERAWTRAYRDAGTDRKAAVDLRRLRDMVRDLQQEVETANYATSRFLSQDRVPAERLQALLETEEGLLARAQALSEASRELHRQVVEDGTDGLDARLNSLEVNLQRLETQFIERTAMVGNDY